MFEDNISSEEEPLENLCDYDQKNLQSINLKYIGVLFFFLLKKKKKLF